MIKPFSSILLTGGASSRMGTDKTALIINGKTLLERQTEKLIAAGAAEILICGKTECDLQNARCIPDMLPHRGPLGGIYSGLHAAKYPCALVLSADVPLLPVSTLRMLCEAHKADVTLLKHGNHLEPLIGIYNKSLTATILPMIRDNSASVRSLLNQCLWNTVEYQGDEALLCNCNTPEDFKRALQLAEKLETLSTM